MLSILVEPARSELLARIALTNRPGAAWRLPRPSELFRAIRPGLEARIIRDKRHTDIELCRQLARVPDGEQGEFYDRYLADPMLALRWAALPRWARPIMAGDADDKWIFGLFTMVRMRLDGHANGMTATLAGLARSLVQEIGFWDSIKDHRRAQLVLSTYGSMLAHGEDVGDVVTKPWDRVTRVTRVTQVTQPNSTFLSRD